MWTILGSVALTVLLMFGAYRVGTQASNGAAYENGYKIGKADGDKEGYKRGVADNNILRDQELKELLAEMRQAEEIQRRENIEKVQQVERERQALIEANRKAYIEKVRDIRDNSVRLAERLRLAETAAARSKVRCTDSSGGLPKDSGDAGGDTSLTPFTEWLLSEGGGRRVIQLAEQADRLNEDFELCKSQWPK